MKNYLIISLWFFFLVPIYGHVTLITPKSGELLKAGEETLIEWEETIPHETQN